ncbi:hypothetical protein MJ391_10465 [Escherichia coli]|nr:hypothetical protein MJ391_10465 [Escherichia coli]
MQEYAPPKTIDAHKARQRLFDIIAATISVLGIAPNKLVLKTRERQKGKNQYQKLGEKEGEFLEVTGENITLTCAAVEPWRITWILVCSSITASPVVCSVR